MTALSGLRVALVGPLPPPAGGMAGQTQQLAALLGGEGARVELVQSNAPVRPRLLARVPVLRAIARVAPYVHAVWRAAGRADLMHVMANSGWSWHLVAAPAIWIGRARGVPVIVNYRGGQAAEFLETAGALVRATMARATTLVVPSGFLDAVFARHGMHATIVANIVDLERFAPRGDGAPPPRILIARNLEAIYDVATALRAFARVRAEMPQAAMTVAGEGPEREALLRLRDELRLTNAVDFCGRLDRDAIAGQYREAAVVLNPSRVDNMPNSVLEAMAARVPVVSTDVGGVPYILRDGVTGLLVRPGDDAAMSRALVAVLRDRALAGRLAGAAYADVQQYAWPSVRERWIDVYAAARRSASERPCAA